MPHQWHAKPHAPAVLGRDEGQPTIEESTMIQRIATIAAGIVAAVALAAPSQASSTGFHPPYVERMTSQVNVYDGCQDFLWHRTWTYSPTLHTYTPRAWRFTLGPLVSSLPCWGLPQQPDIPGRRQ